MKIGTKLICINDYDNIKYGNIYSVTKISYDRSYILVKKFNKNELLVIDAVNYKNFMFLAEFRENRINKILNE